MTAQVQLQDIILQMMHRARTSGGNTIEKIITFGNEQSLFFLETEDFM